MGHPRAMAAAAAVALVAIALVAALLTDGGSEDRGETPRPTPTDATASAAALARAVSVGGVLAHMRTLERIADDAGGNRAAGSAGDRASERYVAGRLRGAGWRVRLQPVRFPFSAQRLPPRLSAGGRRIEASALRFSGRGSVAAQLAPAGSGCRRADYSRFPPGTVAIVRRGSCLLRDIVLGAQAAGAVGVIVFDEDRTGPPLPGTLISPGARIPAVTVRRRDGRVLARDLPTVRVRVDTVSENRRTRNVIAETGAGSQVVMAGAHLDSVPEGPGVNDNGSGVATLLELARQIGASRRQPRRRVRLAFWGAEELGVYGSRRYVRSLPRAERRRIVAYLNLDMVGSSNGGRILYGGTRGPAAGAARAARRYLRARGVRLVRADVGRGSDHAPFVAAGVPVLGLFSGATDIKRPAQRRAWGGRAGRPFDACYHLACDRLDRVDRRTLSDLGDAAVVAVHKMAFADASAH
jgi:hypothetical protein